LLFLTWYQEHGTIRLERLVASALSSQKIGELFVLFNWCSC